MNDPTMEGNAVSDLLVVPHIKAEAHDMESHAIALPVNDDETNLVAGEFLVAIRGLRRRIDETFDPVIDAAYRSHKAAIAAKKKHADPVDAAERIIKRKIGDYSLQEESRRRVEEARLQAEARAREEEARLAEAVALEQAGESALADSVIAVPLVVAPVVLPPPPTAAGVSTRTTWAFRIVNPAIIPRDFLTPDRVKIGGVVRALKGYANIPGIEPYEDRTVAVRG